jgi:prophage regulatory protein
MERLLRLKEVLRQTGLGRTSLYEKMKAGDFPKQVKLGPKASAWPESAVQAWISGRVGAGSGTSQ